MLALDKNIGVLARAGRMPAIVDLNMAAVRGPGSANQSAVLRVTWLGRANHRAGNSNSLLPLSLGDLGSNDPSLLTTAAPCRGRFPMSVEHLNPLNCRSYSVTGTCATLSQYMVSCDGHWWPPLSTCWGQSAFDDGHNQSIIQCSVIFLCLNSKCIQIAAKLVSLSRVKHFTQFQEALIWLAAVHQCC